MSAATQETVVLSGHIIDSLILAKNTVDFVEIGEDIAIKAFGPAVTSKGHVYRFGGRVNKNRIHAILLTTRL